MPRNLDIALVRAFVTVVDCGSVTRAARLLNLSQGAISQQIHRLEQVSEAPLFMRRGRNLILTPHGQSLVAPARRSIAANEDLLDAMRTPVIQGEVRFGAPYDIIGSYAPAILRRFSKRYPSVRVILVCRDTVPLLSDLAAGAIDLALTTEQRCRRGGETLRRDRLVWVGARDGDAWRRDPLPLSLGSESCVFRPVAISALRRIRRDWLATCEISNMEPVRATLEADLAVAPLLQHSVPAGLRVLPADKRLPRLPEFCVNLYGAAQASQVVQAFADCTRHCVAGV